MVHNKRGFGSKDLLLDLFEDIAEADETTNENNQKETSNIQE